MPRVWRARKLKLPVKAHAIPLRPGEFRFFARILTADLACPRCDKVTRLGGTIAKLPRHRGRVWEPRLARFCCPGCGLTLLLGVLAHPIVQRSHGSRQPPDQVPSWKQALELRRALPRLSSTPKLIGEPVNQLREELEGEPGSDGDEP